MDTAQLITKPTKHQYFDSISMVDYLTHLSLSEEFYTKVNHIENDELVYISIIPDNHKQPTRYFWPDGEQFKKP